MILAPPARARIDVVSQPELARAAALMRNNPATRILNARIVPHWIEGGARFWYRRERAPAGMDYVMVAARTGKKQPAFDHLAAAAALRAASGTVVASDQLNVTAIGNGSIEAQVNQQNFRCATPNWHCVPLTASHPGETMAPDGQNAVFRRDGNLWLRNVVTGRQRQLTTDGDPEHGYGMPSDRYDQDKLVRDRNGVVLPPIQTWWSPDSRHIVTARLDQRALAPYPYIENAPRDGSFRPVLREVRLPLLGEPPARLDWWVIDVATAVKRQIDFPVDRMIAANNGIDDLKVAWTADSRTFLAISGMTGFVGAEAFAVDLATGHARVILEDRFSPGNPLVAGGYGRPVARFIRDGRELLWWSERDGWGHLYRYDVASGRMLARITQGRWMVRDVIAVDEPGGKLWFTGIGREPGNPYHRYLYRTALNGGEPTLMSPEAGDHMIVDPTGSALVFDGAGPTATVAPDFKHYVYDVSDLATPTRTVLRSADANLLATVERADARGLVAAGYHPPELVKALAADGKSDLWGLVYRPSDYDPSARYPVVDIEYGNPAVQITPSTYHRAATFTGTSATPAALAELGFVVVVLDARGTPYRGRAFSHAGPGYLATMGLEDHIAFIRSVAAHDPGLDLAHVGIAGQSFGGYTAVRALTEFPDFFKVAVAGSPQLGYHNMAAEAILTASQGPPVYGDGGSLRPTPAAIPENFRNLDAASRLDRLTGHLLIFAGDQDENVYPGTIAQFMDRAIRENRNVDYVWMPNTAHEGQFTPYALRRSIEFLVHYLQGRLLPDEPLPFPAPAR